MGKALSDLEIREVIEREAGKLLKENDGLRRTLGMPTMAEEAVLIAQGEEALEGLADIFVGKKIPKGSAAPDVRESRKAARKAFVAGRLVS